MLDLKQLRYFMTIVEEKTILAAAKRLHMSQPPLSQQLRTMEENLGVSLFYRKGRKLVITEAGKALYQHAYQMIKLLEAAEAEVKEIGSGEKGKLRIGVNTLSDIDLPHILAKYEKKYPNITYNIHQNESSQLIHLLELREIDAALIRMPFSADNMVKVVLQDEPFYYITSVPTSSIDTITLEDIVHQPLILPSTQSLGLYEMIVQSFISIGLTPNVKAECSDTVLLANLVEQGFASSIVPHSALQVFKHKEVQLVEIENMNNASYGIVWKKDFYLPKTTREFIRLVTEHFQIELLEMD
ncbi:MULTISPECIES: LysR family transcriptional regulator [Rossellomorea]|jgi:LysR family transcriptional regulator, salicylic acid-responsive activator of bsdBCD|uniref:LysR family transcriptional regulator n=1 Tax=Rossellomorea TaxID=2837508 RepID=UPI0021CC95C0|nr:MULTISPECIES: LysR family transcriptional regulator [Rossellomorea]MDT9023341.1 LysR family transcriptional regulator [Rossellomorea sp. YC4-1]